MKRLVWALAFFMADGVFAATVKVGSGTTLSIDHPLSTGNADSGVYQFNGSGSLTNAAAPVNCSLPVDPEKQFFRVRAEP